VELPIPGVHNVLNALAAIAAAMEIKIPFPVIQEALKTFGGVQRRFQLKGTVHGINLIDDYGHHPTEIKATLSAAKAIWKGRVVVLFQPHRYTRTRDLYREFLTAFNQADLLLLTDIYAAGEDPLPGVTAEGLFQGIKERGHKSVLYVPRKDEMADQLIKLLEPGDSVITLGAGDITQLGDELMRKLKDLP
jgi:UDP-N-acetylmuramate--alanine ligase